MHFALLGKALVLHGWGSPVIGDYIVCGIKSKASGLLVDLRRVVIYWVDKKGEGRKAEELFNHKLFQTLISSTQLFVAPLGG